MNGLAICAGIGGLELGLHIAMPGSYRTVCFIEREAYAAASIVARMADKTLDQAPIWDDLTTFDSGPWRGIVDIISAGFPCQPFSLAGNRKGDADERWLWPHIERIICDLRPRFVFLENVPGILTASGGIGAVLSGLASAGFDAEWGCFSAAECGAPHRRERWFCLAYTNSIERSADSGEPNPAPNGGNDASGRCEKLAYSQGERERKSDNEESAVPRENPRGESGRGCNGLFPPGPRADWSRSPNVPKPAVRRDAYGAANRVERLRALGNGVVPLVAAYAFRALATRAGVQDRPRGGKD